MRRLRSKIGQHCGRGSVIIKEKKKGDHTHLQEQVARCEKAVSQGMHGQWVKERGMWRGANSAGEREYI